jgi:hypothetical protein
LWIEGGRKNGRVVWIMQAQNRVDNGQFIMQGKYFQKLPKRFLALKRRSDIDLPMGILYWGEGLWADRTWTLL